MAGGDSPVTLGTEFSNVVLQASYDGRLKNSSFVQSSADTAASLTASAGKDLYVVAAQISFTETSTGGSATVDLVVDGTVVERTEFQVGNVESSSYNYKSLYHKITPGQTILIDVQSISSGRVQTFIQAIEVPSGENPLKYTGE